MKCNNKHCPWYRNILTLKENESKSMFLLGSETICTLPHDGCANNQKEDKVNYGNTA
jgi:hypothetical protein